MDHINDSTAKFTFPILVLQGDDDKICDPAGARRFIDAIPTKDKKLITYKVLQLVHHWWRVVTLKQARHEIHYDVEREKEEQDILRWITARMTSSAKL